MRHIATLLLACAAAAAATGDGQALCRHSIWRAPRDALPPSPSGPAWWQLRNSTAGGLRWRLPGATPPPVLMSVPAGHFTVELCAVALDDLLQGLREGAAAASATLARADACEAALAHAPPSPSLLLPDSPCTCDTVATSFALDVSDCDAEAVALLPQLPSSPATPPAPEPATTVPADNAPAPPPFWQLRGVAAVGATGLRIPASSLPLGAQPGAPHPSGWSLAFWIWLAYDGQRDPSVVRWAAAGRGSRPRVLFFKGGEAGSQQRTPSAWLSEDDGPPRLLLRVSTQPAENADEEAVTQSFDVGAPAVSSLPLRRWVHLAFTFHNTTDGASGRPAFRYVVAIDGEIDTVMTVSPAVVVVNDGALHIGAHPDFPGTTALLAGVQLFDGVLTPDGIAALRAAAPSAALHGEAVIAATAAIDAIQRAGVDAAAPTDRAALHDVERQAGHQLQDCALLRRVPDGAVVISAQAAALGLLCSGGRRSLPACLATARMLLQPGPPDACPEALRAHASHLRVRRHPRLHQRDAAPLGLLQTLRGILGLPSTGAIELGATQPRAADAPRLPDETAIGWRRDAGAATALLLLLGVAGDDAEAVGIAARMILIGVSPALTCGDGQHSPQLCAALSAVFPDGSTRQHQVQLALGLLHYAAAIGDEASWAALARLYDASSLGAEAADADRASTALFTTVGMAPAARRRSLQDAQASLRARSDEELAAFYYEAAADAAERHHTAHGLQPLHELPRLSVDAVESGAADFGQRGLDDEAIKHQLALADAGVADAQLAMADLFYWGARGVPRDHGRALQYFEAAAAGGLPQAAVGAGSMWLKGEGTGRNMTRAMELYREAAAHNQTAALNGLGYAYFHGQPEAGIERNVTAAYELFALAAVQWVDSDSAFNAAHCLWHGIGVAMDRRAAILLWRANVRRFGHFHSVLRMGRLHATGEQHASCSAEDRAARELPCGRAADLALPYLRAASTQGPWTSLVRRGFDRYLVGDGDGAMLHSLHAWLFGIETGAFNAAFLAQRGVALPGGDAHGRRLTQLLAYSVANGPEHGMDTLLPLAEHLLGVSAVMPASVSAAAGVAMLLDAAAAGSAKAAFLAAQVFHRGLPGVTPPNRELAAEYYRRSLQAAGDDLARALPSRLSLAMLQVEDMATSSRLIAAALRVAHGAVAVAEASRPLLAIAGGAIAREWELAAAAGCTLLLFAVRRRRRA